MENVMVLGFVLCCSVFLIGYILGKRRGISLGKEEGEVMGVLDVRIRGLESGRCQICGTRVKGAAYPLEEIYQEGQMKIGNHP